MTDVTSPYETQTPRTDAFFYESDNVTIPSWLGFTRQLELELIGSRRIIAEMGVELRKAQERCAALEKALTRIAGQIEDGQSFSGTDCAAIAQAAITVVTER